MPPISPLTPPNKPLSPKLHPNDLPPPAQAGPRIARQRSNNVGSAPYPLYKRWVACTYLLPARSEPPFRGGRLNPESAGPVPETGRGRLDIITRYPLNLIPPVLNVLLIDLTRLQRALGINDPNTVRD